MNNQESKFKKILFWNLGIYFAISIIEILIVKLLSSEGDKTYHGLFFMIFSAFSIGLQVFLNLVFSIYFFLHQRKDLGKSFLLSLLCVLLIGFPLCFGGILLGRWDFEIEKIVRIKTGLRPVSTCAKDYIMEEDKFKKIIQWNIGIYFIYLLFYTKATWNS